MNKSDIIKKIVGNVASYIPSTLPVTAYAPTNIALCKYWGKRNREINLPVTSSLSISLGNRGAETTISISPVGKDIYVLNGNSINTDTSFYKRLSCYLDLVRPDANFHFHVSIVSTVPIAAGLASSACGFAALVMALDKFFSWQLSLQQLSILARLGSGSASRSLWSGFVEWHVGKREDGLDSYAEPIAALWPELRVGLIILSEKEKSISSREAMQRTIETSDLYKAWPLKVETDLTQLKHAIQEKDFELLGKTAESNALAMHATMLSAWPPVSFSLPETISIMHKIWKMRAEGISVYFTQDAGPNLKLLFTDKNAIQQYFPQVQMINPWADELT